MDVDRLAAVVAARARGGDELEQLAVAVAVADEVRDEADELVDRFVSSAREAGRSWTEIGASLGVTKQAAQQRFVAAPAELDHDASAIVAAAQGHARSFHHRYVGTEHLLLALSADTGLAGTTLARLGVDEGELARRIREEVGAGHSSETATLGISPRAKRVLDAAGHEARRLGHRCRTASPEHVLLAVSAHGDAVGARILRDLDISDDQLRAQLAELLAGEAPELARMIRRPAKRRLRRRPRARQTS